MSHAINEQQDLVITPKKPIREIHAYGVGGMLAIWSAGLMALEVYAQSWGWWSWLLYPVLWIGSCLLWLHFCMVGATVLGRLFGASHAKCQLLAEQFGMVMLLATSATYWMNAQSRILSIWGAFGVLLFLVILILTMLHHIKGAPSAEP